MWASFIKASVLAGFCTVSCLQVCSDPLTLSSLVSAARGSWLPCRCYGARKLVPPAVVFLGIIFILRFGFGNLWYRTYIIGPHEVNSLYLDYKNNALQALYCTLYLPVPAQIQSHWRPTSHPLPPVPLQSGVVLWLAENRRIQLISFAHRQ